MSSYQRILTELLVYEKERLDFFRNKNTYLNSKNPSLEDGKLLMSIDKKQIEFSANALLLKRWGIVRNTLNLSIEYKNLFISYAKNTPIKGGLVKHEKDAIGFYKDVLKNIDIKGLRPKVDTLKKLVRNKSIQEKRRKILNLGQTKKIR
jgi:hypothetical protein